jgi:DNA gyrase subunit B
MGDPVYRGQTKNQLTNTGTAKIVYAFVKGELDNWFKKHPGVAQRIIKRAKILARARDKANLAKQALKQVKIVTKGAIRGLPEKLVPAPHCKPSERELFIVEGESAGGSAKLGRDKHFQEILALKGKPPNAMTAKNTTSFLSNSEISDLNTSIGTHVGQRQNLKNCRYARILIMADADPDGKHIATLLIGFFVKYYDGLVKDGKIYIVRSPLFRGYFKNKYEYGFTAKEVLKKFPKGASVQLTRLKGHGEANPEDVRKYALDPKTRKLLQVKWGPDIRDTLQQILGSDASYRKEMVSV